MCPEKFPFSLIRLSSTKVYITIKYKKVALHLPLKVFHNRNFLRSIFSCTVCVFCPYIEKGVQRKPVFWHILQSELLTKYWKNILRLSYLLPRFPLTTSETELDYICQKLNVRVALQVTKQLKTFRKTSKLSAGVVLSFSSQNQSLAIVSPVLSPNSGKYGSEKLRILRIFTQCLFTFHLAVYF